MGKTKIPNNFPSFLRHRVEECDVHSRSWIGGRGQCPDCTGRDKSQAVTEKAAKDSLKAEEGVSAKQYRISANSAVAERNAARITLHGLEDSLMAREMTMAELEKRTGISRKTSYCHRAKINRATEAQAEMYAKALGVTTTDIIGVDPHEAAE